MRTNEERIRLIRKRTAQLKREKRKRKQRVITALCAAASLLLIVGMSVWVSFAVHTHAAAEGGTVYVSGAASLLTSNAALGYILIGIMAFLLGVCVTILLYRVRFRDERRRREHPEEESRDEHDEL